VSGNACNTPIPSHFHQVIPVPISISIYFVLYSHSQPGLETYFHSRNNSLPGPVDISIFSHFRKIIPIPISIPKWRACLFPFPWESHGTRETRGNSHELFTSTVVCLMFKVAAMQSLSDGAGCCGRCFKVTPTRTWWNFATSFRRSSAADFAFCRTARTRRTSAFASNSTAAYGQVVSRNRLPFLIRLSSRRVVAAQRVGCRTCNQEVAGLTRGWCAAA